MNYAFQFFCCTPEPEHSLGAALATAFAASLFTPVPAAPFDAIWALVLASQAPRRTVFYSAYRTVRTVVIDPVTELPVEMIGPADVVWWGTFITFLATAEASCSSGCTLPFWP